jgi:tRNA threonylcarbamoyladenosine biosynthesis protein TsaE
MISGLINAFIEEKRVLSPTFIIVRHYEVRKKNIRRIYHADLYRLEKEEEIEGTGLLSFMTDPQNIVLIEWAEKLGKFLPSKRYDINIESSADNKRKIQIVKYE